MNLKNENKKPRLSRIFVVIFSLFLVHCARSKKFEETQTYYPTDPESYYATPPSSAGKEETKKIEYFGQPKKKVLVLQFWNDTPVQNNELEEFPAEELKRLIYQSKRVIVPEDVGTALSTKEFVDGANVRVAQLVREGRKVGVSAAVIGRIGKIVYRETGDEIGLFRKRKSVAAVDLEFKLFDIQSGREITAFARSGKAMSDNFDSFDKNDIEMAQKQRVELAKLAIREAIESAAPIVVTNVMKMNWKGSIVKVTGNKVYINSGKTSGLVEGDILKVLTPGEDLYDPASGAYLGKTEGQLKGTLEVVGFVGGDGSIGSLHSGGQFNVGDVVMLY